jgi:serine phosphatase RsbU (regulator of sigma subunit)
MAHTSKMKIKTKLIIGFGLMLILVVSTSLVSLIAMNTLVKKLDQTLDLDSRVAEIASAAFSSAMGIGQYEREIILNVRDRAFREGSTSLMWEAEIAAMNNRMEILEVMLKKMNRPDELDFINETKEYLEKNTKGFRQLITQINNGKIRTIEDAGEAFKPYRTDGQSMELILRGITTRAIRNMQASRESVANVTRLSQISVGGGALLSVILGIVISLMLAAGIRAPLNELVNDLQDVNTKLISTNHELEMAQTTAARDMNIAVNVQQSLLQKAPPRSDEWDIAFEFRPKSGVSGDFYEFYTDKDRIIGAGIFDVSGHGISSGLITMLAKSIINRNFITFLNEPLNKVLKRINTELIHELGTVDNYLTGILLRFTDENFEYVNAGHTELVLKRGGFEAKIIQPKDEDIKGYFLGVPEMGSQFRSLNFKTAPNDCFLLYSDCVIETVNPQGETFGMERLLSLLNSFKSEVAVSTLVATIVNELYLFSGSKQLNDDLTLIALKKLR